MPSGWWRIITDTHFGRLYDEGHAGNTADRINELEADMVVFGGDLFDNYARDRETLDLACLQKELNRIEAKAGRYPSHISRKSDFHRGPGGL